MNLGKIGPGKAESEKCMQVQGEDFTLCVIMVKCNVFWGEKKAVKKGNFKADTSMKQAIYLT